MTDEQKEMVKMIIQQYEADIDKIDHIRGTITDNFIQRLYSTGLPEQVANEIFVEVSFKCMRDKLPEDKEFRGKVFGILQDL